MEKTPSQIDVVLWCYKWDWISTSGVGYRAHYGANDKKKVNKKENGGREPQEKWKVEEEEGHNKRKNGNNRNI